MYYGTSSGIYLEGNQLRSEKLRQEMKMGEARGLKERKGKKSAF